MSSLGHALHAAARFAFALGAGFLACGAHASANTFEERFFTPDPALQIGHLPFQLASLTPFDVPQDVPTHRPPSQPFGAEISGLVQGGVQRKWSAVKKMLPREHAVLMRCQTRPASCTPATKRFLAIIDKARMNEGWARIAEINRSINLNIKPTDDIKQYGVADLWATPLMTFKSNAGDCEDYAIAKYVALREIGFLDDDLRLLIIHVPAKNEHHAVAAVRYDGRWLLLDNQTLNMRQDVKATDFDPLFVIDGEGVKRVTTFAAKPPNPWANTSPAAVDPQLSLGWSSKPLFL